jgi:hypothetical protein
MSVVVTSTIVVASQVTTGSVVAPILLASGAAVAATAGVAAIGYALTKAPFWKEIEQSQAKGLNNNGFCNLESFQTDFINQTELNYERLMQMSAAYLPTKAYETVAALMTLQTAELVAAVADDRFGDEFRDILNKVPKVQEMNSSEIESLNRQTADLLEKSLNESRLRVRNFVAREFKLAMEEIDWTIKDEAQTERGNAFLATNRSGQSLAACIDKNGTITTDMSGFSGRGCETAIQTLFTALERRGIRLNRKKEQPHYLFAGGAIINRVSKAEQILENAERQQAKLQKRKSAGSAVLKGNDARRQAKKGYLLNRLRNMAR